MGAPYPDLPEYDRQLVLAFEKEVLGVYISGHPLEENAQLLKKNVTALSSDFVVDEETGQAKIEDGARVTIGGMVTAKTVKTTKSNQLMAFVTVEDMLGSVEVIVFPRDYERYKQYLNEDERILVSGRVSIGDDPVGRLVLERLVPFADVPKELWLQFEDRTDYEKRWPSLKPVLQTYDGRDTIVVYLKTEKQYKKLPLSESILVCGDSVREAGRILGEENVKIAALKA